MPPNTKKCDNCNVNSQGKDHCKRLNAPVGEEWEKEFENLDVPETKLNNVARYRIKSFIRSLLTSHREAYRKRILTELEDIRVSNYHDADLEKAHNQAVTIAIKLITNLK